MRLIHVMVSIPLALAALPALASLFLAAIRVKEGHTIVLYTEHLFGLGALCLLFVAASAVAVLCKGTPKHVIKDDFAPSCLNMQATSTQPQPSIQHLLDVPDLVWNVFERLDPASRRAFFQAHRDVAQNGHVLAHAKLWIELRPQRLQDQWQRVLRLTRSQPPRCLVIAGPNKERLQGFLRCMPRGKHEEKQRVLQGTEVQLQVYIRLETGGIPHLQDLMRSWRNGQPSVEDTRVQLVLDLCGRELIATSEGNLEPPSCCTLRNGTLQLRSTSLVRVSTDRVHFESIVIVGTGTQLSLVSVERGGSLVMQRCCAEGGLHNAISLFGGSLCAQRCSIQSSKGYGLYVGDGGETALEHVTASMCGLDGVRVHDKDSTVSAANCHMERNGLYSYGGSGVSVSSGACAHLRHCSCDHNRDGLDVFGRSSSIVASESSASSNRWCGVSVYGGASASLSACMLKCNEEAGVAVHGLGSSFVAKSCLAIDNRLGDSKESSGGHISWLDA